MNVLADEELPHNKRFVARRFTAPGRASSERHRAASAELALRMASITLSRRYEFMVHQTVDFNSGIFLTALRVM
jgi:hypothetical protein